MHHFFVPTDGWLPQQIRWKVPSGTCRWAGRFDGDDYGSFAADGRNMVSYTNNEIKHIQLLNLRKIL